MTTGGGANGSYRGAPPEKSGVAECRQAIETLMWARFNESGAKGSRTLDLCIANAALSQLSYRPKNPKF